MLTHVSTRVFHRHFSLTCPRPDFIISSLNSMSQVFHSLILQLRPTLQPPRPACIVLLYASKPCHLVISFSALLNSLKTYSGVISCKKPFLNPPCCIECPSLVSFCFSIIAISSSIYLFMCLPPSQHFNLLEVRNSYLTSYLEISMSVYLSILICPYISGYISKYHHVDVDLSLYPGRYSYLIR